MKHAPCEYIVWYGLPILRKEIVKSMVNEFGLSQKEAADKMGVTPAAVSQYLSGKRANIHISDEIVCKEIYGSVERIIQRGDKILVPELCRLCKFFLSKKLFPIGEEKNEKNI